MRALLVGWFSWRESDTTAGDEMSCELVRAWLEDAGVVCDVALVPPFTGGVELREVNPSAYSHVVFVCGPFVQNHWEAELFHRFADCIFVGINVTLPTPLEEWNPFDLLIERDSTRRTHPDLVFAAPRQLVPIVGRCLVEPYGEALVAEVNAAIARLLAGREAAIVEIDTRRDVNFAGLRTSAEIESLVARVDALVTTRLHGLVLALRNNVPALAIDPEPGGGKILRQARAIDWPWVLCADALSPEALEHALSECLSPAARARAGECARRAGVRVRASRDELVRGIFAAAPTARARQARTALAQRHRP